MKKVKSGKTKKSNTSNSKKIEAASAQFRSAMIQMSQRVVLAVLVFSFGGIWLDSQFETKPLYSLVGIGLGLVITTVLVKRTVEDAYPGTFGGKK